MTEIWSAEEFLERQGKPAAAGPRSAGGRMAQAAGKGFEAALEYTHAVYRASGVADIWRLPVDTAPMPPSWMREPKKAGIARILRARQRGDYAGWLKDGRGVLMEAKACAKRARSMAVGDTGFGIKLHQLQALADAVRWNAMAALVWLNGEERLVFPGKVLLALHLDVKMGTVGRIDRSLAIPFAARTVHGLGGCEDWLSAVLSHECAQK